MSFARGKRAFGFCDRTGKRYPLTDLVDEYQNGTKTGFRVGRDVADKDHPQNHLGRLRIFDPQSLMNPRPDTALDASRALYGFGPVGHPSTFVQGEVGRVSISFTTQPPASITNTPLAVDGPGAATGQVGSVDVDQIAVGLTGLEATASVGVVTTNIVNVSGVSAVSSVGAATTNIVSVTSATATSSVGSVTVSIT